MTRKPETFWKVLPVALLLMSFGIGVTAVIASSRGHGRESERDYYERGLDRVRLQERAAASVNLGWKVEVQPDDIVALGQRIDVRFVLTDAEGELVLGAAGKVRAIQNADAGTVFEGPLVEGDPGVYVFTLAPHRAGIWRWQVEFERGETFFVQELRAQLFGAAAPASGPGAAGGAGG